MKSNVKVPIMSIAGSRLVAALAIAGLLCGCGPPVSVVHVTTSEEAGSLPGDITPSLVSISGAASTSFHGARLPSDVGRMLIEHTFPRFIDGIAAPSEGATRQFLVRTVGCDIADEDTLDITPVAGATSVSYEQMTQEHGTVLAKLQLVGLATAPSQCRADPLRLPKGDAVYWIAAPDTNGKFVSRFIDYDSQLEI